MVTLVVSMSDRREHMITADQADVLIARYEGDAFTGNRYEVRRYWDRVSYSVAVALKGEALPFLALHTPLTGH
jgi:hypothetical protein